MSKKMGLLNQELPPKLNGLFNVLVILIMGLVMFVSFYGTILYRRLYCPEISSKEYLSTQIIIVFTSSFVFGTAFCFIAWGSLQVIFKLSNQGKLDWWDWVTLLEVIFLPAFILFVLFLIRIYRSSHHLAYASEEIVEEYIACLIATVVGFYAGGLLISKMVKKIVGVRI